MVRMEWNVPSDSDPTKIWTVKIHPTYGLSCNCPIWIYNKRGNRTCKHTDYVEKLNCSDAVIVKLVR